LKSQDLIYRLLIRASIRRQATDRKSVQEGKRDRIADLLEEAAIEIENLRGYKDLADSLIKGSINEKTNS
jgi:hypothetical protein